MPETKHILVLANSIKKWPNTCVAGREIVSKGSTYEIGKWIRPVSNHNDGAISPQESLLERGRKTKVLDFVEIQFEKKIGGPAQPENWLINPKSNWKLVNRLYEKPDLKLGVNFPTSLWLQPNQRQDRVSTSFAKKKPPKFSLRLIHVPLVSVRFGWNEYDGELSQQRKAKFTYRKVEYEFGLTDPVFSQRYRKQFPAKGQPANTFEVTPKGGCYLCVSLTPQWESYHYKVVATVLESNAA